MAKKKSMWETYIRNVPKDNQIKALCDLIEAGGPDKVAAPKDKEDSK